MANNKKEKTKIEKFKELWADKRWKAIIKLGIWFSVFFFLFIILSVAAMISKHTGNVPRRNVQEVKEEKVEANIPNLINHLNSGNYSFVYTITNGDVKYSYNGTKNNDEIVGYYESSNGIIKYAIKDNIYYKLVNDEYIEDNTIISEEDKQVIDLNNLVSKTREFEENNKPQIVENTYTYDLSTPELPYIVNITKDEKNISKIEINYNNINYVLEYKNVV